MVGEFGTHRNAGAMLRAVRERWSISVAELAYASAEWTPQEVEEIERTHSPRGTDVVRYHEAVKIVRTGRLPA